MVQGARSFRIASRREISFLWRMGSRWTCSAFTIVFLNRSFECDRAAFIVGKANGNAVQRNKAKRILREIFRNNKSSTPPFFDILIKPAGKNLPSAEELRSSYLQWKTVARK
jgi:ribonuclease P protein component